jgi:hypothetical protein
MALLRTAAARLCDDAWVEALGNVPLRLLHELAN